MPAGPLAGVRVGPILGRSARGGSRPGTLGLGQPASRTASELLLLDARPWPLASLLAAEPRPRHARRPTPLEAKHLKNIRQVTSGFAKAGEGYFRPDGQAIIFQAVPHARSSSAAGPTRTTTRSSRPTSPDARPRMVSTGKGKCTCSTITPTASRSCSPRRTSTRPSPTGEAEASRRARPIAGPERYRWDFDPAMDIFQADPDGKNLVRLTDAPGYDAEGSYSPDGKQIIFTSFRDGDAEIYIMDADGKNPRRITHAKGYDGGPFFSPDGKQILYRSDRKENDLLQVYINNTEGTAERALTEQRVRQLGAVLPPRQPPHHLCDEPPRPPELRALPDGQSTPAPRSGSPTTRGSTAFPVFSADGKRLMWTSSGRTADKKSQLFIADFHVDSGPGEALVPDSRSGLDDAAHSR